MPVEGKLEPVGVVAEDSLWITAQPLDSNGNPAANDANAESYDFSIDYGSAAPGGQGNNRAKVVLKTR